ncbi:MAG TPA: DUF3313 domain-containing protein [Burkholderiales bacterium]|nr:DUF3313 domain-containing protein [Burkholderiales bacterium]
MSNPCASRKTLCIAGVVLALGLAPLAHADNPTFGEYTAKGFLSDYSNIKADGDNGRIYRYRAPGIDAARYKKLMIERIRVWLKPGTEDRGIDPAELKELVDYFHKTIVEKVQDAYPVVEEAGPDVLRVRLAVTDIVPNKVEATVVSLVVPYLWMGEAGAGAAKGEAGSTPFVGEATIELEALDSVSGEQVAAYIETRVGKKYVWTEGVQKGVDSYLKAYSTWAYTKQSMDGWAALVRTRLDAVHGKAKKAEAQ